MLANGTVVGTVINTTPFNLAGYTPSNAPEFSATLGIAYTYETSVGPFTLAANEHYTSSQSRTNDDSVIDPPHHVVDLSLNWASLGKRYDASLWVKNLGNEYTYAAGQISTNFVVVPGPAADVRRHGRRPLLAGRARMALAASRLPRYKIGTIVDDWGVR